MIWLLTLCLVLAAVTSALTVKLVCMRKAANEIRIAFAEKLKTDTNTLISISSNDTSMRNLANDLNLQLRELRAQRHRYVQGDLELKNAVTTISHDLRTPLTAISAYLDLLEQAKIGETAHRYVKILKNRTQALGQLTEELFQYSILIAPKQHVPDQLLAINGILEESILGYYAALQERKITPTIHMTEQRVVRSVDRAALARAFSNILSNAVKYSDGDLEITLTESGKILFVNTASRLSQIQVERLFDRFYVVEDGTNATGLGLSIARTLVEHMGGTVTAQYDAQRLTICVSLPDPSEDPKAVSQPNRKEFRDTHTS